MDLLLRTQEPLVSTIARTIEPAMKEMQKASSETPGQRSALTPNRCYQCHGRFGLVRHRYALRQFCTKQCLERFRNDSGREAHRLKKWAEFLTRK
jgi:hypothetical protein